MARLMIFVFVAQIILAACALISCLSADKSDIRALPRFVWVLIILFFPLLGSIAWFFAGRPVATPPGGRAGRGPDRYRPVAPDDNPEFLGSLAAEQAKKDRELFERWEEDLRRREGEIRRRESDPPIEEKRPEA
ncbi:PLD nuclease N-terminal domain-containing protein [Micromonospora sp. NPDC050397]|uniref:PLD nuclease N-terminal domain-containing protein n=1 Tax=Micromonospora sp. NPDC050397 TaxID=3364279 RepID=UPI00384FAE5B